MSRLLAQGDILLELVRDTAPSGTPIAPAFDGAVILAEGEVSGHRHAIWENVAFFRDDSIARSIPRDLYIGHVNVPASGATLLHEEHAPILLEGGTYRVSRQRQLEPLDVRVVED